MHFFIPNESYSLILLYANDIMNEDKMGNKKLK